MILSDILLGISATIPWTSHWSNIDYQTRFHRNEWWQFHGVTANPGYVGLQFPVEKQYRDTTKLSDKRILFPVFHLCGVDKSGMLYELSISEYVIWAMSYERRMFGWATYFNIGNDISKGENEKNKHIRSIIWFILLPSSSTMCRKVWTTALE